MEPGRVETLGHQCRIPEQGAVVEHGVVLGERQVVGQAGAGQVDGDVVGQGPGGVDDAVVQVRGGGPVVEEHQLAGVLVDAGVGRDAPILRERPAPRGPPPVLQGHGIHLVEVAALEEADDGLPPWTTTSVDDASFIRPRAPQPSSADGRRRALGQARPQGATGLALRHRPSVRHEPVAVGGDPVPERHGVEHAVAVEGVVALDGRVDGVLGVAQVDAVQVGGHLAGDIQVGGVALGVLGPPRPVRYGWSSSAGRAERILLTTVTSNGAPSGGAKRRQRIHQAAPDDAGHRPRPERPGDGRRTSGEQQRQDEKERTAEGKIGIAQPGATQSLSPPSRIRVTVHRHGHRHPADRAGAEGQSQHRRTSHRLGSLS